MRNSWTGGRKVLEQSFDCEFLLRLTDWALCVCSCPQRRSQLMQDTWSEYDAKYRDEVIEATFMEFFQQQLLDEYQNHNSSLILSTSAISKPIILPAIRPTAASSATGIFQPAAAATHPFRSAYQYARSFTRTALPTLRHAASSTQTK